MNEIFHKCGRFLAPLALAEWGTLLTYFYCSGRLVAYLHPNFRPLVFVTGILLLVSAACVACFDEKCSQHACDDEGCGVKHGKTTFGRLLSFVVLVLPIALAAKISPDSFGAGLVQNRGVRQTLTTGAPIAPDTSPAAHDDNVAAVRILDLIMAAQDPLFQQDFIGRRVEVRGRFFPKDKTHCELICTLVTCCAVDAQMLSLRIDANTIPALKKLAWTKVIGRVSFVKTEGDYVPIITAESIAATVSPQEQFDYGLSRPPRQNRAAHH